MGSEQVERIEAITGARRTLPAAAERPVRTEPREKVADKAKSEGRAPTVAKEKNVAVDLAGQTYAQFIIDDKTGHVSIKIINSETQEVVREIPPESMAKLTQDMKAYQTLGSEHRRQAR